MSKETIMFEAEKEVKHSIRFKEVVEQGKAPIVGTIYVQKWYVGSAKQLFITIEKSDA